MKKHLLICLLFAFGSVATTTLHAQGSWTVKAELGGAGLLYQVGVSRTIHPKWSLGLGVGSFRLIERGTENALQITSIPIQLLYDIPLKNGKNGLECGIGLSNLILNGDLLEAGGSTQWHLNPHLLIHFRHTFTNSPWLFRAGINPVFGTKSIVDPTVQAFRPFGLSIMPLPTFGFGYRF